MNKESYYKLIGKIGNEYYFLDETFEHSKNFKGATGTILAPVTQAELDERWEAENMREQWQDAVDAGMTNDGLEDWIDYVKRMDGGESILDESGANLYDQLRAIGVKEEEYPFFDCTGGGRCFRQYLIWDKLYDPKLWKVIKKFENI